MIQIVTADGRKEREVLQAMRARAAQAGAEINRAVAARLEAVGENGSRAAGAGSCAARRVSFPVGRRAASSF